MGKIFGDGIFNTSGEKWRIQRQTASSLFHFNNLQAFVEVFLYILSLFFGPEFSWKFHFYAKELSHFNNLQAFVEVFFIYILSLFRSNLAQKFRGNFCFMRCHLNPSPPSYRLHCFIGSLPTSFSRSLITELFVVSRPIS